MNMRQTYINATLDKQAYLAKLNLSGVEVAIFNKLFTTLCSSQLFEIITDTQNKYQ